MRNTVLYIADIRWSARLDRAKHKLTLTSQGGAIAIQADTRNVKRDTPDSISLGGIILRDKKSEEAISELYRFCHFPEWPVQDTRTTQMRLIRQQLEPEAQQNHAAP